MDTNNIQSYNGKLADQLALQMLQFKRLLGITQAINANVKSKELFEMYRTTLTHEMRVESFALFICKDGEWECVSQEGIAEELTKLANSELFMPYTRTTRLRDTTDLLLNEFEFILPVYHKKYPIACVLLRNIQVEEDYIFESLQYISTITNIIAVALENKRLFKQELAQERLKRDLELAVQVQNMLIPSQLPSNKSYEFAGVYQPHEGVGGDYYDLIQINEEEIAFCIADISGKGVAAAMLMSNFQANLHALIHRSNIHVKKFIEELNAAVLRTTKGDKFITFFIARYNIQKRRLRFLCAGHNPPLLLMNGKLQRLDKGCTILGAFSKIPKIEMGEIYLDEEAFVFLYTDGLTDLSNEQNEYFDESHLEQFILNNQGCTVQEFNTRLMQNVAKFKGENDFPDDISILTGRIFATS